MRIAVCGLGRLGRSLLTLLPAAGHAVETWRRGEAWPEADVYWLTVRDAAVPLVAPQVPKHAIALHASGVLGIDALAGLPERGVLHLLQSFPGPERGIPDVRGAGAGIDGTPRARAVAGEIATSLGMRVFDLPRDRVRYHAAACLSSGHLAATFLTGVETLVAAGVAPDVAADLLYPLARDSLLAAAGAGSSAITGPASRGDLETVARHLAALEPGAREVYEAGNRAILRLRGPWSGSKG